MFILVIKSDPSSLWFQLWNMPNEETVISGRVLKIGLSGSCIEFKVGHKHCYGEYEIRNHSDAMQHIANAILCQNGGVLRSISEISAIGHYIPHGGSELDRPALITPTVKKIVTQYIAVPPHKNACALAGVEAAEVVFPNSMQIGVFDTSYAQSLTPMVKHYALPKEYNDMNLIRHGAHGITHEFVRQKAFDYLNIDPEGHRLIVCSLQNEVSISASLGNTCVDISTGFSCYDGPMSARSCGACDPSLVSYIANVTGKSIEEIVDSLTRKAGLVGVCNYVADMRDVLYLVEKEDPQTKLAWDMYVYSIQKCIAALTVPLHGVDTIVLTGNHGVVFPKVRSDVLKAFDYMGISLDAEANQAYHWRKQEPCIISKSDAMTNVLIVPHNDELAIARKAYDLAK